MPLYNWKCSKCGHNIEILRTFDQYQVPPSSEDETSAGLAVCNEGVAHGWERHISTPATIVKTWAWSSSGSKGNW